MTRRIPSPTSSLPLFLHIWTCISVVAGGSCFAPSAHAANSAELRRLFAEPSREYSSGPLWVWNDMLTEAQIVDTLRDLAEQQVKQVFVHPRPGLMTPYLSEDWFRLWKIALREAERLDMNVWIYDENSYPSGFAGGWVPELMPDSRGRGLILRESKTTPKWQDNTLAVFRVEGETARNVTDSIRAGRSLPEGRYIVAEVRRAGNSPWTANRCYVDLLYPGVTEKFLEVTLEAYRRRIGEHFGKRVPGSFTDEPQLRPAGGLPWTEDLPQQFHKRWGYSLLDNLAGLRWEVGDWRKVRHNYFQTVLELFIERWAKPYYEYCRRHDLEFTGHYWEHEWPGCTSVPDNMALAAWQQRPGIDTLMNQYREDTHAQFGNVRACREVSSLANQLGRKRTLVELYGAGGWDLRFEDMKRIGDWLQVLGINTLNEHLSYVTIRGARKRDHPQSFSYHEPWWEAYHVSARYFARLTAILTQGEQINRILVLEPTTTAWMYQGNSAKLAEIGDSFFKLLMALETAQVEYDLGCEDTLARHGSTEGPRFRVGQCLYETVVIPPLTENLNSRTAELLDAYLRTGGAVLCCGQVPERIDGNVSNRSAAAATHAGWKQVDASKVPDLLLAQTRTGLTITRRHLDEGILFHQRRVIDDGEFLFLVNTSIESPAAGKIESAMKGVESWNMYTGAVEAYPFEKTDAGVTADFELPPSGSLLLFLSQKPRQPARKTRTTATALAASGTTEIRRVQPNVLTLDYVDITAGGETQANTYFYRANQFAWQKNGMDRNPWDSAVQFRDEIISKTFGPDSGFTAHYRFTIEDSVPPHLAIVIERPDLYTITCNGKAVSSGQDSWWLDRSFGKIDISGAAKVGENVVTIIARPFTIYHELEPAYVLGDFTLRPAEEAFVIIPDKPLEILPSNEDSVHTINPDGTMWLSGGVGFADGIEDLAPFIVFDLGRPTDLETIKIWNYNESHVRDLTARGVDELRIFASANEEPDSSTMALGSFRLARAEENGGPEIITVRAPGVRFVKFEIVSNHHGVRYPPGAEPVDNGFVGLAEVRFVASANQTIRGVKIRRISSELTSFGRTANHLVDGSGLVGAKRGWRRQGHPFYGDGVAYRRRFELDKRSGKYVVSLPDWYGSVAKVTVNGDRAGYVVAPPWECDVTDRIRPGENTVEVVVIGTLKNTLGPHHVGAVVGSAWPGMFQKAPETGPPPGWDYHTIDYGLFEPFLLKQVRED